MRATYEDLLRTARRMAVNAHRSTYRDEAELMADWRTVLAATVAHLRWLRGRLKTVRYPTRGRSSANSLGRLARAIGAGADLLAAQDPTTARALDDQEDLLAARAEVAAIALIGARVVLRDSRTRSAGYHYLLTVVEELEWVAQSDLRRSGLGPLGGLTAGAPPVAVDGLSMLARNAARWERAHGSMPPRTLLTRDLRSATAQLRTVCGSVWQLADHLLAAPSAALEAWQLLDLKTLKARLRAFDAGAIRIGESWQRRVSDVSGQSSTPAEAAFLDLRAALDEVMSVEGRSLPPAELVQNPRVAARLLDAMDELVWAADRVARNQQYAVAGLILEGRLFVPRHDVAKLNLVYLRRPGGGSRPLQAHWVRTNLANCFDELTDALAWSADHLAAASGVARRLAGTSHQSRQGGEEHTRIPAPYIEASSRPRRSGTTPDTGIADQGQLLEELDR